VVRAVRRRPLVDHGSRLDARRDNTEAPSIRREQRHEGVAQQATKAEYTRPVRFATSERTRTRAITDPPGGSEIGGSASASRISPAEVDVGTV